MANEITPEAQKKIDDILRKDAYDRAQSQNQPRNNSTCGTCGCSGGNGTVRMYGVYMPCPSCAKPSH